MIHSTVSHLFFFFSYNSWSNHVGDIFENVTSSPFSVVVFHSLAHFYRERERERGGGGGAQPQKDNQRDRERDRETESGEYRQTHRKTERQ